MNKKREEVVIGLKIPGKIFSLYIPRAIVRSEALQEGERDLSEIFLGKAQVKKKKEKLYSWL